MLGYVSRDTCPIIGQPMMVMSRIFKGNMRTWTETIKLTDKKKLRNVTKEDN